MEQKKKKPAWLPWVIIITVIAAGVFIWNYMKAQGEREHEYTAYTLRQREPLVLKGASEVQEAVAVSMDPSKGEVRDITVRTGERVTEGDVLFSYASSQLDDRVEDMQRQYDKAVTQVDTARADLQKAEGDQEDDEASLSSARDDLESSRKALREAEKDLADAQAEGDADEIEELTDRIRDETEDVQEYSQDVSRYQARVDSWPAQIDQLKKMMDQAESALEDATMLLDRARDNAEPVETADITGLVRVNDRNRRNPQAPLVEIVSEETLIKATVTEYDHFRLVPGKPVNMRVVSTSEEMSGVLTTVEPLPKSSQAVPGQSLAVSSVNYGFEVKPERPVQPGYTVEILVDLEEVVVPGAAVAREGENTFLWLYSEGAVSKKPVTLERSGAYWILKEGLSEGDVIIQDPDADLMEGAEVRTIQP